MSTYTGFGTGDPGSTYGADGGDITTATAFVTSRTGQSCAGARLWVPTAAAGNLNGARAYLWDTIGTSHPVAPVARTKDANLVKGWNNIMFDTPLALNANQFYYIGFWHHGNIYSYISHLFDNDLPAPSGAAGLTFLKHSTSFGSAHINGAYDYGSIDTIPTSSGNNTWFGTDVIIDDGASAPIVKLGLATDSGWVERPLSIATDSGWVEVGKQIPL